ncbi:hypothetical protein P8935_08340 [Telmatobacter sp. DSM 110680]|uniref:Uncharacterized protein n=1 Tax=Telmatobacter sp. DSM 110680 TaxID=3036704 RepID=A0AAU7DNE1_9BACT
MKRIVPFSLLLACTLTAIAQRGTLREGPLITLYLPRAFPSEKVEVRYFLTGSFGGNESYIQPQPDRQTIDFTAAVDGKAADKIKVIAFLPGCEIIKLDIVPAGTAMWRQLECKPLKTITLRGQIQPFTIDPGKTAKVEVTYQADWALPFFGIFDGAIPAITVSAVVPSESGEFTVEVPDFQSQPNLGQAGYAFILREVNTGNILDFLVPTNATHVFNALAVNQSYPPVISFASDPPS